MDGGDVKPFKCEFCPKSFKLGCTLKTHLRIHTGEKPFQCDVCSKKFTQSGHLKEHSRTHTGEKPYQCLECGKAYVNGSHLRVHMRSHTKERPYNCKDCGKSFAHLNALKVHSNQHTGGTLYKYPPPDAKNVPKRFSCNVCGSAFRLRHVLKIHLRSHSGARPYMCELCSKGFTQVSHLRTHISTHASSAKYKCGTCGRTCGSAGLARRHARSHSQGAYRCSACGERFQKLTSLKTHTRRHTGEKAYKCGVCSRGFGVPALLAAHMRTHSGEKPFQCEVCSKCFAQRSVLACHLRIHKGDKRFICDICSKRFINQSDLVKHRRIHTGEKPYKCEFCNSCFGRSNHLTRHMKIHFRSKKIQTSNAKCTNTLGNRDCVNERNMMTTNKAFDETQSFSRISAFGNYFENGISVLNGRPLPSCQNGMDLQNFPNLHNRFLNNGSSSAIDSFMISDRAAELEQDYNKQRLAMEGNHLNLEQNHRYNSDLLKYQNEAYDFCKQSLHNMENKNQFEERHDLISYAFKSCEENLRNVYGHSEIVYPRLDNVYRGEKISETSGEPKVKSSSCKWRYPNTGIHLKNSCKEVDAKMADNCKPWQCGICDVGFSQQAELVEHVDGHKSMRPHVKYTKLVTNPKSGILEEKEMVPRGKLKIVPIEMLLQPIFNTHSSNRNIPMKNNKFNQSIGEKNTTEEARGTIKEDDFEVGADIKLNFTVGNTCIESNGENSSQKSNLFINETSIKDEMNSDDILDIGTDFQNDDSSDFDKPLVNEESKHEQATGVDQNVHIGSEKELNNVSIKTIQEPKISLLKLDSDVKTEKSKMKRKPIKKKNVNRTKEYPCTDCSKVFKYSHSLAVHHRLHTGQRPYACPACPEKFTQAGQLREHAKTHGGERRFQCHQCGKSFVNGSHLKSHLKTHTGEKPYSCDVCQKKFSHRVGWKLHQNIHTGETPYKCEACGKGFRQPSSLRSHQLTHTGERPFSCGDCGKRFAQRSTLAAHSRVHGKGPPRRPPGIKQEKRFACQQPGCEKIFGRKAHLKRHVETHRIVSDTIT